MGDKIYIARQDTLESVNDKVGAANDTGGSSTAGSLMGKQNAALEALLSSAFGLSVLQGYVDEIESMLKNGTYGLSALETLVDEVESYLKNSTYGLSALQTLITTLDTVADNIYAKVDTEVASAVSNTATNNTASSTGVLSQKLSYIISTLIGATGATGGTATAGTVMAKLNAIMGGNVPVVRKVQRGYTLPYVWDSVSQNYVWTNGTVSLSGFTNSNKMIAILKEAGTTYNCAYVNSLTTSALTLDSKYVQSALLVEYTVIEFY